MAEGEGGELDPRQSGQAGVGSLGYQAAGELEVRDQGKISSTSAANGRKGLALASTCKASWVPPIWGTTKYSTMKPTIRSSARWRTVARQPPPVPARLGLSRRLESHVRVRARRQPMSEGANSAAPVGEDVFGLGGGLRQLPEGAAVRLEGDEDRVVTKATPPPALAGYPAFHGPLGDGLPPVGPHGDRHRDKPRPALVGADPRL